MSGVELLVDAFGRIKSSVHRAADGLDADDLAVRIDPDANSIGWLVWHLTRIQDDHIAGVAGIEQCYASDGWWERLDRPFDISDHGYGHTSAQVASLRIESVTDLLGYHDVVHDQTVDYLRTVGEEEFNRVVDTNWDPPVTLGVRLVSVVSDNLQHVGQAAYVRGVIGRRD